MEEENLQTDIPVSRKRGWQGTGFRVAAYWFNLVAQPLLAVIVVLGFAWLFGYAQRNLDWFNDAPSSVATEEDPGGSQYACSMLCVFVEAPGRCPVCGMQLQKIETSGDPKDLFGVTIDPAARRLANIETVAALNMPVSVESEVLGRIEYDETSVSTVSAYVDGRIEKLLTNYTGAVIRSGDEIAVIYSPDLYADQVGFLQARNAALERTGNERADQANQRLYKSARQRLIERGLPAAQVDAIEQSKVASRRLKVHASMSGTVIERLVAEGDYVQAGTPILKLADLSTVWLMLEMYPEDVTGLKIGQAVSVEVQSRSASMFEGKVSFVAPNVDAATRTVRVRVALANDAGLIRVGDLGRAKIRPDSGGQQVVVVPRECILTSGSESIAYVETQPGRFEFRHVQVGRFLDDRVAIVSGIQPGEFVVASGAFMVDSTFNIQGKASLLDPYKALPATPSSLAETDPEAREIEESFAGLSDGDRRLALEQVICPITEVKLGTMGMGTPIKVDVNGTPVMICCEGCRRSLLSDPGKYFETLRRFKAGSGERITETEEELPQMELPEMDLPEMELPQMELPK
ncbi:MAG: efflux RND transporter periplasmic adaptor subunit [Planctomycetota bacterium]